MFYDCDLNFLRIVFVILKTNEGLYEREIELARYIRLQMFGFGFCVHL